MDEVVVPAATVVDSAVRLQVSGVAVAQADFGGEAPNTEEVVGRWLSLDKNKDEKLSKEELGERMQTLLARADTDKDGFASKAELAKLAESESGGGRGGSRGGGPGGGEFGGRGGGPPESRRGGRGRPEFGRGEPNPEEFVNRALEFDANKDGQLNKEELGKMAEGFGGRGFGGRGRGEFDRGGERGGRGRGGFGGERGGPRGGGPGGEARPQRTCSSRVALSPNLKLPATHTRGSFLRCSTGLQSSVTCSVLI